MADLSQIELNGTTYNLKDSTARYYLPYGVCDTESATAAKTVSIDGITEYVAGMTIAVKFTNKNTAVSPTLNINSLGAKSIYQYGTTVASVIAATNGWQDGAVVILVYDGAGWLFTKGYNPDTVNSYTITSVWCNTEAAAATKISSNASYYALRSGNIFEVTMRYSNSYKGALTFNVNGTGAKPIFINGSASSSSNNTLPAGKYIVYFNGVNYQFRTDGKAPISISGSSGNAATVNGHSVLKDVPSNAVFTDTTYTADTSKLVTTTVPNVTSVGSAPTLGTAIPADDITAWTTNTPTAVSVSNGVLTLTSGSAASLSYTAKSIPNITSVGSAPTLGTAITVATGSLASDGGGASVATGITAS